jgi:protein SCO1/2
MPISARQHLRAIAVLTLLVGACAGPKETPEDILARLRGGAVKPTVPKPTFILTDQHGNSFDFRTETDGHVTLLFFGYTYCPDICPLHMARIGAAMKEIDPGVAEQIKVVFVSLDPDRDTPERLSQWLGAFHPDMIGLTGSVDEVNSAVAGMGFAPARMEEGEGEDYAVSHPATVIAYTPDNIGRLLYFFGIQTEDWVHDLPILVESSWN